MSKGQKRGNKEARKPKTEKKPSVAANTSSVSSLMAKNDNARKKS